MIQVIQTIWLAIKRIKIIPKHKSKLQTLPKNLDKILSLTSNLQLRRTAL